MKKRLNNRANHKNLDLSCFYKNWANQTKRILEFFRGHTCKEPNWPIIALLEIM